MHENPRPDMDSIVDEFLNAGRAPTLVFQPIVALDRLRAIGYEALSRFSDPRCLDPREWFAAAQRIGRGVELEASIVEQVIAARNALPPHIPLGVNVSPEALQSDRVQRLLDHATSARLVFELTEHDVVDDYDLLARAVENVRSSGGLVAVDDAGAAHSNLRHILEIRPDFIKLDRAVITGLHAGDAKAAVVELFTKLGSAVDAWLVAEGIEDVATLHALQELGIFLGQGYLLGRPSPTFLDVDPSLVARYPPTELKSRRLIAGLELRIPPVTGATDDTELLAMLDAHPDYPALVVVDDQSRPVGLVLRDGPGRITRRDTMVVSVQADPVDSVLHALLRPLESRFDPLACCDEVGVYCGIAPLDVMAPGAPTGTPRRAA